MMVVVDVVGLYICYRLLARDGLQVSQRTAENVILC